MTRVLAILAAAIQLFCVAWIDRAARSGPTPVELEIPGGVPASLYLPRTADPNAAVPPEPPAAGEAPPAVLLVHGYSADRASMGVLARRFASAGYGVLAIDLRGHGESTRLFARDPADEQLLDDLSLAVDWLRRSPWLDGERLAVVGHSMGAGAALRLAERDPGIDAAILISGDAPLLGPGRPANTLLIYAEYDPERVRAAAEALAARLAQAGADRVASFARGDAVRAVEMPGNDHTSILWSAAAAREMIAWLDATFDVDAGNEPDLTEPRALPVFAAAGLLPLTLLGLGLALGTLVPGWPSREGGRAEALGGLALALLAALPLAAGAPLASFLGLEVADAVAAYLFGAGLLLCAAVALGGGRLIPDPEGWPRSVLVGGAGFAALYLLIAPIAAIVHDVTPTPERARLVLPLALLLFPFFFGFEHCVRRGRAFGAFVLGLSGRVIMLAALGLGVALEMVPFVVVLLAGPLAIALLLGEIVAAGVYAAGGNRLVSATLQAALLAWLLAATMPLRA